MGCGCICFSKHKVSINNNINKIYINDLNKTEKESKNNKQDNIINNEPEKLKISKQNTIKTNNSLNKIKYSLGNKYSSDMDYYATNEDFSEYYLLLGNDIETLTIRTEIFISCKDLPNFSRSFGYYVLIEKKEDNFWSFFGQTEISRYTPNPSFLKTFIINYNFRENEEKQIFKFIVKYVEKDEKTVYIGENETNLQTIFTTKNQEITLPLKEKAQISIKGVQKINISEYFQMRIGIKGPRMSNKKIFCRISRKTNNKNELFPLYVTEEKEYIHDKKDKIFYWKLIDFDSDRIAKKQLTTQYDINIIKFQIYEVEKKKKQKRLIEKEVNIDDLNNDSEFDLPKVADEYYYLKLDKIQKVHHYSFFSFLISGMNYTPYFFIDCTRSKFNLILSEKLGNKYSKKFINKYKKDFDNNKNLIYHPWVDNTKFQKNSQIQNNKNINEKILQNINGTNNFENNILNNNLDEFINKNMIFEEENLDNKNEKKNPFENKKQLSEYYAKYINELFNSIIKDQFLLNINNRSPVFPFGCRVPKENQIECYNFSYNLDIENPEIEDFEKMHKIYNDILSNIYLSFPCIIQDSLNHFYKYVSNENFTDSKQTYHVAFFILTNLMNDVNYLFEFLLKYNNLPFSIIIISLGDEFKHEEFESKIEEYIKENEKKESFRNNLIYINFNSFSFNTNDYKIYINTFCKKIYYQLSQQFVRFIKFANIKPLDSINLAKKNTPNFLELRKDNIYKTYNPPKFLAKEKEKIVNEILDLGYSKELFEYTFDNKLPTFDKHFIISLLNNNKNKYEKIMLKNQKRNIYNKNKTFKVEYTEYFRFNDQMMIDERAIYFGGKFEKKTSFNQEIFDGKKENIINNEICNFCKTNSINIIFQYCKHKYSCIYCLSKIKNKICPICKKKINYYVRIYNN